MTARTAGFRTRAQIGLDAPRSRSTNVDPEDGGTAIHWAGPGRAPATLEAAERLWRQWQDMHMAKPRGWADIAYSLGATQTGHLLAGRGYGVRTAAQGTNDGNDRFLAIVWIGGEDSEPTQAALDAIEWGIADFQEKGAGLATRSHRTFHPTSCAGETLTRFARSLDGRRIRKVGASTPPPLDRGHRPGSRTLLLATPQLSGDDVVAIQRWVGVPADGHFGPRTRDGVAVVQRKVGIPASGVVDAGTWGHYAAWVKWRAERAAAAKPAPAPAPRPPATAKPALPRLGAFTADRGLSRARNSGAHHAGVEKWQRALAAQGLYRIGSDEPGRFGDDTEAATKTLQRQRGLVPDGVVGPATWPHGEKWS